MKTFQTVFAVMLNVGLAISSAQASKEIKWALDNEPPQLNATKATDQVSFFVLGHLMEGLTRYGKDGKSVPGIAEKWTIGDTKATFSLRKGAKWHDGKPVTAKDFVFGWQTAVDPKTASEYAFILYPVKNGEKINKGEMKPSELGVKALDDNTLEVTFEKPCGYFLSLTSFPTFYPLREDLMKQYGEKYGADADKMAYTGPFILKTWVHGASLRLEKNPSYWNVSSVKIDAIDIPNITNDQSARFNLFKNGKSDLYSLRKEDLSEATKYKIQSFSDGSVFYLEFNHRDGKITRNKNLRKAVAAIFNPDEYVKTIVGIPGTLPGIRLIPSWVGGVKGKFTSEHPISKPKQDIASAKKYMEAARKELGGVKTLNWLTGDSPLASKEAEYFQDQFKKHLGIDLKIDKQTFKQRLAKMTAGEFDIVAAGWGPDYADAMTFADLFASWNENNRGRWKNEKYDEYIRKAQGTADANIRIKAMADAEKILLDEGAIMPTYERRIAYLLSDRVKGVVRHTIGPDPDFTHAEIVK